MQALYATTGIIGTSSLAVTQNGTPNMSVNIAAGWAAILGTSTSTQGVYVAYNDATTNTAITTAPSVNSRIDLVCLTVSDAYYSGVTNTVAINVVAGTVAASPVVPSTPANSIALAQIAVGTNVTSIVTANITDLRVNTTTNLPVVTLTGTQTLTNKTLTTPVISSISNTGLLTLPTSTDTIVGRATTDTLTNKTLTSPVLTTPSISNIDAKGDILVGTANDTLGVLTAGNNGETLVADSSTSTGLRYTSNFSAGKNKIINGDFGIWQRSNGTTTGTITAATSGATTAYVVSNSFVVGQFVTVTGMTPTTLNGAGVVTVASGAGFTIAATTSGTFSAGGTATGLANFTTTSGYTSDRWFVQADGTGTFTTTQQAFSPGTAPVAGYEGAYYLQSAITSVGTSTTYFLNQRIEDVRLFAGQTATLSFWAKADSTRTKDVYIHQYFGTGGSADYFSQPSFTVTSSWQRYSFTFAVPSISGKTIGTGSYFEIGIRTTMTTGMNLQVWGVQLESGSVATPFSTATGTVQGELAACQRYYWRTTPGLAFSNFGMGLGKSATVASFSIHNPVTMRTNASSSTQLEYSTLTVYDGVTTTNASSAVISGVLSSNNDWTFVEVNVASGLTQFRPYVLTNSTSSSYIGISAEL